MTLRRALTFAWRYVILPVPVLLATLYMASIAFIGMGPISVFCLGADVFGEALRDGHGLIIACARWLAVVVGVNAFLLWPIVVVGGWYNFEEKYMRLSWLGVAYCTTAFLVAYAWLIVAEHGW